MQEANGDRLDALRLEFIHRAAYFLLVERRHDAAVDQRAFFDADAARARDQRPVGWDEQIVKRDVDRLDAAPHLDAVAKALGRDHAGLGAALVDQDVGGERRAVHQHFDLAEKLADI